MLAKSPRFFMVVLLFFGCLVGMALGFWGGLRAGKVSEADIEKWSREVDESPIRSMEITIAPSQQERLFTQLQNFADDWRYAIRIAPADPDGESFIVQMWRSDMKLSGSYSTEAGTLNLGFYNTIPARRIPWWFFDGEIRDLKKLINKIPDSTFLVEK